MTRTPSLASRPAWWQWPTVLSLDAPAVTMSWQVLFARAIGVPLHPAHVWVLAASVWLAYVADRWSEGWRLTSDRVRTQRHRFYQRYRWPVATAWVLVLCADVGVSATALTGTEILKGLVLTIGVAGYLAIQLPLARHDGWRMPKEACTALLLTTGVGLFLSSSPRFAELGPILALFGLLCFTNCALISGWERDVDLAHGPSSMALRSHRSAGAIRVMPFVLCVGWVLYGAFAPMTLSAPVACGAASAAGLAAINYLEPRFGWRPARVLADVALLTPLIALLTKVRA